MRSLICILQESLFDNNFGVDDSRLIKFINILIDSRKNKTSHTLKQLTYSSGLTFEELLDVYNDFVENFCNKIQKSKVNVNDWYTYHVDTRIIFFKGGISEKGTVHWVASAQDNNNIQVIEASVYGKGDILMYKHNVVHIYRQLYKVNKHISKKLDIIWKEKYMK